MDLLLDGRLLTGVDTVVYDAGQKRLAVTFSVDPRCSDPEVMPMPGQLVLALAVKEYPVVSDIVYHSGTEAAVLSINTSSTPVDCVTDALFSDRFTAPG